MAIRLDVIDDEPGVAEVQAEHVADLVILVKLTGSLRDGVHSLSIGCRTWMSYILELKILTLELQKKGSYEGEDIRIR